MSLKDKNTKKKVKKSIPTAIAHIFASFNNTIVTIADTKGNVFASCSSGMKGFKGARKSTPYAGQIVAKDALDKALECGVRRIDVEVKGPGGAREAAIREFISSPDVEVVYIKDKTKTAHNGCRPRKKRRV